MKLGELLLIKYCFYNKYKKEKENRYLKKKYKIIGYMGVNILNTTIQLIKLRYIIYIALI